MPNKVYLTKSRYAAGLQCLRRLWLNVHQPADREEPALGSVEDIGLEIGRIAHRLFPGGVLVQEAPWEHAERKFFGGTCVNTGCTPTKTLVASAFAAFLAAVSHQ
jgi:hypothetical protein